MMRILCLGMNYKTASVALRERVSFGQDELLAALSRFGCGKAATGDQIEEVVILSTCNRTEIYATSRQDEFLPLFQLLSEVKSVPQAEILPHCYTLTDEEAVEHLFRVACGLDSQVLGEPQILGQVTDAYMKAHGQDSIGKVLSRLFQSAIHAGKRARTETAIGQNPVSVSSVAVRMVTAKVEDIANARVGVLGAGEMAELAVEALRKHGVHQITVVNRTLERAEALAARWEGKATTFEQLNQVLIECDVLITSTGAPHTLIHRDAVEKAMQQRNGRSLVIVDIAIPRDVDAGVGEIEGVYLYDIDALNTNAEENLAQRMEEIPHVEKIISEEIAYFMQYYKSLDLLPLIATLHQSADQIRQAELRKTLRHLPNLAPEEQERIDALSRAIVKKLLHHPTTRLRRLAGSPQAEDYADVTRALFGLE